MLGVRETGGRSIEQLQGWLEEWGADTGADASRLFLEQMTVHHEGAITMAQDEVDNGQNADAVALAQTIVETQTAEIATMQELLAQL
jgi:uncharacterized protein (DUF305 family)